MEKILVESYTQGTLALSQEMFMCKIASSSNLRYLVIPHYHILLYCDARTSKSLRTTVLTHDPIHSDSSNHSLDRSMSHRLHASCSTNPPPPFLTLRHINHDASVALPCHNLEFGIWNTSASFPHLRSYSRSLDSSHCGARRGKERKGHNGFIMLYSTCAEVQSVT